MEFYNLFKIKQKERNEFCTKVIDASAPSYSYYFLVILSTLIVAIGLMTNNIILVIGGMLVTPLLSPVLALALGIVIREPKVIVRSARILGVSMVLAFIVAMISGLLSQVPVSQSEFVSKMDISLLTPLVAIVAGVAASFTWVKPILNETLPGIAVTVTLIPPLTATGLTIAHGEIGMFKNVFVVLLLNLFGIILASIIIFSLMEFYKAKRQAVAEVKEEEQIIKKEKKQVENNKKGK